MGHTWVGIQIGARLRVEPVGEHCAQKRVETTSLEKSPETRAPNSPVNWRSLPAPLDVVL